MIPVATVVFANAAVRAGDQNARNARARFVAFRPSNLGVSIAEDPGPQFKEPRILQRESEKGKTAGNLHDEVTFRTICFRRSIRSTHPRQVS